MSKVITKKNRKDIRRLTVPMCKVAIDKKSCPRCYSHY